MEPNPFTMELFKAECLTARKNEIAVFGEFLDNALSKKQNLESGLIIVGPRGIGKTSLLEKFSQMAEKRYLTATVYVVSGESVTELMDRIVHLSKKPGTEKGLFIFIDDIENLKRPRNAIMYLEKELNKIKKQIPTFFVCSSTVYFPEFIGFADELKLSRLTDAQVKDSITRILKNTKVRMGEECLNSIIKDSEGNQLILFNICWTLYNKLKDKEKIITKGHYLNYKSNIMNKLCHKVFDELYYRTSLSERKILKEFAYCGGKANVSDIARSMKMKLNTLTTLVLRLYESGNLVKIDRGSYNLFTKLYSAYLKEYV